MGLLIEGHWKDQWYESSADGAFQREQAQRRHWVTADGQPGPSGEGGFKAEAGRYHLYVSLACPWAHRTLILRKLKGLESMIDVSVVSWLMLENGWTFDKAHGSTGDKLDGFEFMHQRYTADTADYTGRVTVPVLWDKQLNRIVSNESAEIIRMFNSAFNGLTGNTLDFYPEALRPTIDGLNERIYPAV
ncbi:MAG TPA: glutathione-dependent reductase, partial [Pseudomonas sp.]|nr:glutathione-dependent reductase [Pseudomonas sp.]